VREDSLHKYGQKMNLSVGKGTMEEGGKSCAEAISQKLEGGLEGQRRASQDSAMHPSMPQALIDTLSLPIAYTELFPADPCRFLENAIGEYIRISPLNHLTAFNSLPIVDEPLVDFADGDDGIFQDLKTVIGEFHLTPREIMEKYIAGKRWQFGAAGSINSIGVVVVWTWS
jgi:hypothetical protein